METRRIREQSQETSYLGQLLNKLVKWTLKVRKDLYHKDTRAMRKVTFHRGQERRHRCQTMFSGIRSPSLITKTKFSLSWKLRKLPNESWCQLRSL